MNQTERMTFEGFARARLSALLRFGYALTGNQEAASDLVQEALVRTGARWSWRARREDPERYTRRVMINTNVSWWRQRRREWPTASPPDRGYDMQYRDYELWRALSSLPARQRAVLVLRYYEDLSEAQAADLLGCSIGTVKSQSAKAIAKLRAILEASALEAK
jgi:RNA polymerase sigma-70 factor (sigma-E family)